MPVLEFRGREIAYEVRLSRRARRLRIVVRPGLVEAVAPQRSRRSVVEAFVEANRDWILARVERLEAREAAGELTSAPQRWVSGSSILFRGRRRRLLVEPADVRYPTVELDRAFTVRLPGSLDGAEREAAVERYVTRWLTEKARREARTLISRYAPRVGREPTALRIGNQKTLWGSCSARGTISLNRRLLGAPQPIFEYVVVHELCHLRERNHGPRFWKLVESILPDYRDRRAWLQRHGISLG